MYFLHDAVKCHLNPFILEIIKVFFLVFSLSKKFSLKALKQSKSFFFF